ncbi:unnamed protein product [Prorocentrum cordatum]|uniref:Uncharacterized protein n=1 Tax=Prorocentrum cordatum TaxID=2364126 RepID=A0ABN9TMV0_9DINO|nr:unnamed protein product [Polarella glacialis]
MAAAISCRDGIVSGASDLTTSASSAVGASTGPPAGLERRVAWLEEDVAVLHRRQRDECGVAEGHSACSDLALYELVRRLDGELRAERRAREALEARQRTLEEALRSEQQARESHLRSVSAELRATVDELVQRVDRGLCAGVATSWASQRSSCARCSSVWTSPRAGGAPPAAPAARRPRSPARALAARGQSPERFSAPCTENAAARLAACPARAVGEGPMMSNPDQLIHDWDELRQENLRLRELRAQQLRAAAAPGGEPPRGAATPQGAPGPAAGEGLTPLVTPCLAQPSTLQVPGSGLAARPRGAAVAPYAVGPPCGHDPFGLRRSTDDAALRPRQAGAAALPS